MIVTCPTCGAPVEFRFDDSFVRVCGSCRAAVTRTDRGAATLGQFADLVPLDSPLKLFASGTYQGASFLLVGMAQLRHGSGGLWQEWYARFGEGRGRATEARWGWLSEAQGRYYLTFERVGERGPAYGEYEPGGQASIAGQTYTVAERGEAEYLGAAGEIPFRLTPGERYAFTDLADGRGGFATVDHGPQELGDEETDETLYLGYQVQLADLRITGGEDPLPTRAPAQGGKLACPNCGGALELNAPDATLRIGCPYCGTLVSVAGGALAILGAQASKPELLFPLGTKGTFAEGALTVIGFVKRSVCIDGVWFPFDEYLLHSPTLGFRWLVQSDGHWSYVQPVAPGAVDALNMRYDGVTFKLFQRAPMRVDQVLGELYWQVQIGELVDGADYIAPPAMLSSETTATEQTWSLSTYLEPAVVGAALGLGARWRPPRRVGVGPNQPVRLRRLGLVGALALLALVITGMVAGSRAHERILFTEAFLLPPIAVPAPPADPSATVVDPSVTVEQPSNVFFSRPFQLRAGENVVVELTARPLNGWAYAAIDLVNDGTGSVVSFDLDVEWYEGVEGGESWSEGSVESRQFLPPTAAGTYVLRLETLQSGPELSAQVMVKQDVFRLRYLLIAAFVLGAPLLFLWLVGMHDHKKRWENSNVIAHG